jgi:hypothetical protein
VNRPSSAHNWLKKILRDEQPGWPGHHDASFEEKVWQLGIEQGVLGICSHKLADSAGWNTIPRSLKERLRTFTLQAVAMELLQARELVQVLRTLQAAGIKLILLKGAPLSYTLYPAPHLRPRCDTDLLFPDKEATEKAWEHLQDMGYKRPNAVSGELISQEFSCCRTDPGSIQHNLDLHWKLSNALLFSRAFAFDELLLTAIPVPELANSPALSPVHALLLACIHRITHKPDQDENRLIWLYDLHLLSHALTETNWQEFVKTAAEKDVCAICLEGLRQTQSTLGTIIPAPVLSNLTTQAIHEKIQPEIGASRTRLELAKLHDFPTLRQRLQFIKENLFPGQDYMLRKYHTRNRFLLPLLYTRRILKGLPKLFR